MADPSNKTNIPLSRAQAAFSASQQRDLLVKQELEKARIATDAKTVRLKALRLAKEAEDRAAAAAAAPPAKTGRAKKAKPGA